LIDNPEAFLLVHVPGTLNAKATLLKHATILSLLFSLIGHHAISQDETDQPATEYSIAYSSHESGKSNIYLTDAEGLTKVQVTDFDGGNGYAAWSPDGSQIAFYAKYDERKTWSIHVMDADGSNRRRLTHLKDAWDNSPTWSPDGRQIAFARAYRDSAEVRHYELWIMNADGSNQRQIKGLSGGGPYFAPDGRIAYHSQASPSAIMIAHVDGSNPMQLTDNGAENWHPEVSPNGEKIAFMSNVEGNHEVYTMNIDGSGLQRVTEKDTDDWYPSWTPVGQALIFSSNEDGERQIYHINVDGSELTHLIKNGSQAAWFKNCLLYTSPSPRD